MQQGPEYFGQPWAAYYPVEEPATPYMSFDSRMKVLVDQVEYYFSDANLAKGQTLFIFFGRLIEIFNIEGCYKIEVIIDDIYIFTTVESV